MKKKPDRKFLKALGKKARELRKENKMSQDQLAFEVGIRREQIIRIEAGSQSTGIDVLKKVADVFDIKLKELLDFDY